MPGLSPFDPCAASSADRANAGDRVGFIDKDDVGSRQVPSALSRGHAEAHIDAQRAACEQSDGGNAVMSCMSLCALHRLPVPGWLSDAFLKRTLMVTGAWAASWDAAFGRPWPLHTRLAQVRQNRRLTRLVHEAVWRMVRDDLNLPVTRVAVFDVVGEMQGICKSGSAVEKLYYAALADGYVNVASWRAAAKTAAREPQAQCEISGTGNRPVYSTLAAEGT